MLSAVVINTASSSRRLISDKLSLVQRTAAKTKNTSKAAVSKNTAVAYASTISSNSAAVGTATPDASSSTSNSSSGLFGKIFFPSLCAVTFTLGVWQTQRYFEKLELVQKRKQDLSLDPLPSFHQWTATGGNDKAATNSYRRVILHGKFDHSKSILIGPRGPPPGALATSGPNSGLAAGRGGGGGMSSSLQGYYVVTPLIVRHQEQSDGFDKGEWEEKEKKGWLLWHQLLFPWRKKRHISSSSTDGSNRTSASSTINDKPTTIVWINRGWIPRHFINQSNNQILQPWDEPDGNVTILTMESQTERGGSMFTPPSRLDGGSSNSSSCYENGGKSVFVKRLLWMDRKAMEEIINFNDHDDHPPLFVQINTTATNDDDGNDGDDKKSKPRRRYPVQPKEQYVGEFKVTPEVHAGYAVTWFGLSGAGVVMTRKLLMRGR